MSQELTPPAPGTSNLFGFHLALSPDGSTAVVGDPGGFRLPGAVYVLTRDGRNWTQTATLTAADQVNGDGFGTPVAISSDGSTIAVGAQGRDDDEGAVDVFTRSGGAWQQTAELTVPAKPGNAFGTSLALSSDGSTLLVGATQGFSDGVPGNGAEYVFTRDGQNWTQTAELSASDGNPGDNFGVSVALTPDGSTALIGANTRHAYEGAAYVFTRTGGQWKQTAELTASDGDKFIEFATSVALTSDGSTALIGATGYTMGTYNIAGGEAYAFTRTGTHWTQTAELTASGGAAASKLGVSVALTPDGSTALIGALNGGHNRAGSAYVFAHKGTHWTQTAELTAPDAAGGDWFGLDTALSSDGSVALIGAPRHDSWAGAAYVFRR